MSAKRARNHNIPIRADEYEYAKIKRMYEQSGASSMQEYLINMGMNGCVVNVDFSELENLVYEINKIGVNVNQIAHRVNEVDSAGREEIEHVKKNIDNVMKLIGRQFSCK